MTTEDESSGRLVSDFPPPHPPLRHSHLSIGCRHGGLSHSEGPVDPDLPRSYPTPVSTLLSRVEGRVSPSRYTPPVPPPPPRRNPRRHVHYLVYPPETSRGSTCPRTVHPVQPILPYSPNVSPPTPLPGGTSLFSRFFLPVKSEHGTSPLWPFN